MVGTLPGLRRRLGGRRAVLGVVALFVGGALALRDGGAELAPEVVATGVPRPLQLALDGRALIVLGLGPTGDSAAELYRIDLSGELPVDLSRQPRLRIPFADARHATLGSLVVDPGSHELFLGEENGSRIYRLSADERLTVYATGLHMLGGGSTLAFDPLGRLLILDYADQTRSADEERGPPGLEELGDEEYRGPLVFRLTAEGVLPVPRRLERIPPLFPRSWGARSKTTSVSRLISVTVTAAGDLVCLSTAGELFRLTPDGTLALFAQLPPGHGQYNRTHLVPAADGSVFVSGGFHVARIFRVSPEGAVTTVARNLADPEGIALDARGDLYVAESAFHRIVRLRLGPS